MSSSDLGEQPEPELDAKPDEAPGGPADRVERDPDDYPLTTPDQPMSAQVEEEQVPDEIEQPEDLDEEDKPDSDNTEEPA